MLALHRRLLDMGRGRRRSAELPAQDLDFRGGIDTDLHRMALDPHNSDCDSAAQMDLLVDLSAEHQHGNFLSALVQSSSRTDPLPCSRRAESSGILTAKRKCFCDKEFRRWQMAGAKLGCCTGFNQDAKSYNWRAGEPGKEGDKTEGPGYRRSPVGGVRRARLAISSRSLAASSYCSESMASVSCSLSVRPTS